MHVHRGLSCRPFRNLPCLVRFTLDIERFHMTRSGTQVTDARTYEVLTTLSLFKTLRDGLCSLMDSPPYVVRTDQKHKLESRPSLRSRSASSYDQCSPCWKLVSVSAPVSNSHLRIRLCMVLLYVSRAS